MAWQLIFTSAAAGLQPGSFGYCTVARSAAMRDAVASRLEKWSVYTHTTSGAQPIICSHRILTLGRSNYHVLSRITDSGLDYTGRTNFLAHHLVLQEFELGEAPSPADLLAGWHGWRTQWSSEPRLMSAEDDILDLHPTVTAARLPAQHWKAATNDAGAATLLVNDTGTGARMSNVVVHPSWEGEWLLGLYAESLCLFDPKGIGSVVWSVPFTTYAQAEDDPSDFLWRGTWLENRVASGGATIDFCQNKFPAITANSGILSLARTGMKLEVQAIQSISSSRNVTTPTYSDDVAPLHTVSRPVAVIAKSKTKTPPWWLIGISAATACFLIAVATLIVYSSHQPSKVYNTYSLPQDIPEVKASPATLPKLTAENTATPQPTADIPPKPSSIDEAKVAEQRVREEAGKKQVALDEELNNFPKGVTCLNIGSVKGMSVAPDAVEIISNALQQLQRDHQHNVAKIKLYRTLVKSNSRPDEADAWIEDEAIGSDTKPKLKWDSSGSPPSYDITSVSVHTSDSVQDEFVWLAILPKSANIDPINFIMAATPGSLQDRCIRLNSATFIGPLSPSNTLKVKPEALKQLRDKLDRWHISGVQVTEPTFVLQAKLKNNPKWFIGSDTEVTVDLLSDAKKKKDEADASYTIIKDAQVREHLRYDSIADVRKHLTDKKFLDSIGYESGMNGVVLERLDGASFYRLIEACMDKIEDDSEKDIKSIMNRHHNAFFQDKTRRQDELRSALYDLQRAASETRNQKRRDVTDHFVQAVEAQLAPLVRTNQPALLDFFTLDPSDLTNPDRSRSADSQALASAELKVKNAQKEFNDLNSVPAAVEAVRLAIHTRQQQPDTPLPSVVEFVDKESAFLH